MRRLFVVAVAGILSAGCADAEASADAGESVVADASLPTVLVYKAATCGCCKGWIAHMEASGFVVDARDVNATELMMAKQDGGVPTGMSSCHTAIIDGYVVEGHVPAEQVKQLLAARPDVAGIAAPGMPTGSPGMEGANARPYQVMSFTHDGHAEVFAEVDPR